MSSSGVETCGAALAIRLPHSLPQWKREILERRRTRAVAAAPQRDADMSPAEPPASPAAPAHPPLPDDEELRYGPGIVQRLKSRYLDLARKQAIERRRPSLRRAASLDLLDEPTAPRTPPPAAARTARPVLRAPPPVLGRDLRKDIKRARSVDALSRLDSPVAREDSSRDTSDSEGGLTFAIRSPPPPLSAPPPPPPMAPRSRKPRRASPLLSDAERPPPDLVKSTRRLFESTPRRTNPAPTSRVAAAVRGLTRPPLPARPPPRLQHTASPTPPPSPASPAPCDIPFSPHFLTSTPELRALRPPPNSTPPIPNDSGTKPADANDTEERSTDESDALMTPPVAPSVRAISRSALENISRAGQTLHFSFDSRERKAYLPVAATNAVTIGRAQAQGFAAGRQVGVIRPLPPPPPPPQAPAPPPEIKAIVVTVVDAIVALDIDDLPKEENGLPSLSESAKRTQVPDIVDRKRIKDPAEEVKCVGANVNSFVVKDVESVRVVVPAQPPQVNGIKVIANKPRWNPNAHQNTMVFNFSDRKEVPDYIENDGMIIKASKKERLKAGDPGVVVLSSPSLSPGASDDSSGDSDDSDDWGGWRSASPPETCHVRFTNDNVLINGRSSLAANKKYVHLKIQFDDSLTRTFEYPSEASLVEDLLDSPVSSPTTPNNPLGNSPIVNSSLSSYTPSKVRLQPEAFQLGVTRASPLTNGNSDKPNGDATTNGNGHDRSPPTLSLTEEDYLKPCQDGESLNWSQETNQGAGDLLF